MDLLTIAEAAKLTGRHEKTIRRWIKKQLDTNSEAKEKIIQEAIASGFSYRIDKDYLLTHSPTLDSSPEQESEHPPSQDTGQDTGQGRQQINPVIQAKDETIALLKEQILLQQEQLQQKDKQIETILERARETNILLKGYQDKVLLDAPKQNNMDSTPPSPSGQVTGQYTVQDNEQGRQANPTLTHTNQQEKKATEKQKETKSTVTTGAQKGKKKPAATPSAKGQPEKKGFFGKLFG